MKTNALPIVIITMLLGSCANNNATQNEDVATVEQKGGQSTVQDTDSKPDVVKIAVSSKDHSTLVTALKAANYVDALSNAGPFTVFAPVNSAFEQLASGTVETLLKPENQSQLRNILEYHVYVGVLKKDLLQNGQKIGMVSGHNAEIKIKGDQIMINEAKIIGTVEGSNGIIYVIDKVLLPPAQ
ncbi:MAG: fasciclin domain-containing protein [Chitinophagaceae bacterium]|jgi:uncharacterized surface protein with fasciclin (FAS1) repeats|nr:fasciclin domain-containing protein [Chitinophagaceae bacterium]